MPTYVYECTKCGHRFELLQSITDPPRRRCPECHGAVKRLVMPGGGLIFKGSGFYITDYRNKETRERQRREERGKSSESSKPGAAEPAGTKSAQAGHAEQKDRKQRGEKSRSARSGDHAD
ncbi:MAG: zinc ribbon domain-containing protein [Candidatus Eisenbacteria sp.]|nr:zinc ribbon domain-containing protein [Candidatus Eisenbacteria bacterium]